MKNECLVTDSSVISFIGRLQSILGTSKIFLRKSIWADHPVVNSRYENHYGQENARLSSDQRLLGPAIAEEHWFFATTSRLLFCAPEAFRGKFENLWIDDIVHVDNWRGFMSTCLPEWKDTVSWVSPIKLL